MLASILMKNDLVHDGYLYNTTAGDWRIYIGKMPKIPDRVITIYDTPGQAPNPRWLLDYPTVQIKLRGGQNDYEVVGAKTIEIRNRLLGRDSHDDHGGSGDRIVAINGLGDISFNGWDDSSRPIFVFNLNLIIEPSPATSPTNREPL